MKEVYKINDVELVSQNKERVKHLLMAQSLGHNQELGRRVKPYEEGLSEDELAKLCGIDVKIVKEIIKQLVKEGSIRKEVKNG